MRTTTLTLLLLLTFKLYSQKFYEVKWTSSDVKYTALIEFFEKDHINVRVKFTGKDDKYRVAKFQCKGSYFTDNGISSFLFDGSNASIVYPEYSSTGYSADNFLFTGLDSQNRYQNLYTYDDNDLADGHIDNSRKATYQELDPTKDFTEKYIYSFFEKNEPEYNKYLSLHLGSHSDKNFLKLKFKNSCSKEIQTFIRFKNYEGVWQTKGWWVLKPGETAYVEDTKNRVFYFYAEATDGSTKWKGNDNTKEFGGKTYGLREIKTTKDSGEWTTNLTCSNSSGSSNTNPIVSTNTNSTLHLIFVADTQDPSIGLSTENDMKDVVNLFRKATKEINLKFQSYRLYGSKFDKANINATFNKLKINPNDVLIFYYSGHGYNDISSYNKFPEMSLDGIDMGLRSAHNLLKAKNARLTLTIGDLCNSIPRSRNKVGGRSELPFKSGFLFDTSKLKTLFLETKGDLISTSSKKGQWSYSAQDNSNGLFTDAFIDSFTEEVSKVSDASGNWNNLLKRAYREAKNNTDNTQNQDGTYGQSGTYTSNIQY